MKKIFFGALALVLTTLTMSAQTQLKVSGENYTLTKVYDGTTDVVFTPGNLDGVQAGDTVYLATSAAYVSRNVADSVAIRVTYQITGPQAANYIKPADRLLKGKITKRQLRAVTQVTTHKQYNGNDTAASNLQSVTGIITDEDVTVTHTALYNNKNIGTYKPITIHYTLSGTDTANYKTPIDSIISNGSISAITTTLATQTLLNHTKVYDGTNAVTVLNTGTVDGILPGDDAQLVATATYSAAEVGDNLDVTLAYSFSGIDGGNYAAPATQFFSGVGEITTKRLTIQTATTVQTSKVYDRTTSCAVLSNGTPGGVMGSDHISLLATARYQDSLVGQSKSVIVSYSIYGQGSANYLAPYDEILTADITPRRLTILPCSVQDTKVYDSNASAQLQSIGALRNIQSGDSVNLTATAQYDNKNVGTNKEIYINYTIDGPDAGNYDAPLADTVHFNSITPATVGVTGTTVQRNRIYNGKTSVTVTNPGALASFANDNVYLSATAWYNDKNVGTSKVITVRYTLSGLDSANYVTPADTTFTGVIAQRALTMDQHSTVTSTKVYDGTTSCQVTAEGTLSGVINGDDVRVSTSAAYLTADADTAKRVMLAYSIYGNDSANYIAPDTFYTTAIITPRQLDITPCHVHNAKVYDANISATVDSIGTLIHLIAGDSVNVYATAVYDNKNADNNKDIYITYAIQGADAANYIVPAADTVKYNTITPLTVNATGTSLRLSKIYNGKNRASVTSPGTIPYFNGDNVTLSAVAIYDDKNVGTGKQITINYSLTGSDSANYIVMSADTTGEITPLTLYFQQHSTVIPTKEYDGTTTCFKATDGVLTGIVTGDDITLQTSAAYTTPLAGQDKPVLVQYHLTGTDSANYVLCSDTMHTTANITPRQLTVSNWSVNANKAYDETDTVHIINKGRLDNALAADSLTLTTTAWYNSSAIEHNKSITVHFHASGPGIANYVQPADTVITGTIAKVKLIVSGTTLDDTIYNGGTSCPVLFRGHIMNKVNLSHDVDIVPTAVFNDHRAGRNKPVTVTYTLTGADADYYEAPDPDTTIRANIDPLQLTASGTTVTATRPYDGTTDCNVVDAGLLVGVIGSDSVTLSTTTTYTDRHVGTDKPVTATYTIQGPDAANYLAPADNTTLTASITAVPLTIDSTTITLVKQYDANTTAAVTYPGTPVLLNPSDIVIVSATASYESPYIEQGKNIYVTYTLSGANAGNYTAPGYTLYSNLGEITRRKLVQTGTQVVPSRIYDSTTRITVTDNGSLSNLLPNDNVTFTLTSAAYCTKDTGTHKEVYVRGTISGPDVSKYVLDYCDTVYADITPKQITIKGTTPANKVYDGTPNAQILTNGTVDGAFAGDYVTVGTATATYSTIYPTNNATVTIHYILAGKDAHNYTVGDNVYTNMVISPATLRLRTNTLVVDRQKEYDATDTALITDFDNTLTEADGVVGNDSVAVSAEAHYADKNVGTGKTITVHFILSGKDRGNYVYPSDITYRNGVITRRNLTIDYNSTDVDTAKVYDGTNIAKVNYPGDIYGYVPCDSDKVQLKASAYYQSAAVDSNITITVFYSLDGTEAGNYSVQPKHTYKEKGRIYPVSSEVEAINETFDITLAPNPARVGETTYLSSDIQGSVTIELLNAAGQRIMIEDNVTFPMEIQAPVATGIYFIRIIANDGRAYIRKLIVK